MTDKSLQYWLLKYAFSWNVKETYYFEMEKRNISHETKNRTQI